MARTSVVPFASRVSFRTFFTLKIHDTWQVMRIAQHFLNYSLCYRYKVWLYVTFWLPFPKTLTVIGCLESAQAFCQLTKRGRIKEFISIGFRKPSCNPHGFASVLSISFNVPMFYVTKNVKGVQQIRNRLWCWCKNLLFAWDYAMGLKNQEFIPISCAWE